MRHGGSDLAVPLQENKEVSLKSINLQKFEQRKPLAISHQIWTMRGLLVYLVAILLWM